MSALLGHIHSAVGYQPALVLVQLFYRCIRLDAKRPIVLSENNREVHREGTCGWWLSCFP